MDEYKYPLLQYAFDVMWRGMEQQGWARSADNEDPGANCRYRGPEGRRCPVGWIIPDEIYQSSIEDFSVDHALVINFLVTNRLVPRLMIDDLARCQFAHDEWCVDPATRKQRFVELARALSLSIPTGARK